MPGRRLRDRTAALLALVLTVSVTVTGCGGEPADEAGDASPTEPAPVISSGPTTSSTPSATPSRRPEFEATVRKVSRGTVPHSWRPGCPVPLSGLRLIEMTHWGMNGKPRRGKLIVNAKAADDIVKVFRKLYKARYPIRRMRLVDVYKGDDFDSIEADNTSAFNCRPATGSSSWSQHAYGLAIDINPCENPYVTAAGKISHKDCVKYRDRGRRDPGMIHAGDKVVRAFASIGWGWGGTWTGTKDYQHFSSNGR